ncbi:hypothetical protein EVAR_56958_1 [Eumeta japonica]|uniref:Uncharacterized protein n=1 Tax=Eumeta variegata TaxID=151549 RepID=A0A4C1YQN6_EUMVA|nr:hypothetical protein EVAR_56958_1 [Eumeta japonica]
MYSPMRRKVGLRFKDEIFPNECFAKWRPSKEIFKNSSPESRQLNPSTMVANSDRNRKNFSFHGHAVYRKSLHKFDRCEQSEMKREQVTGLCKIISLYSGHHSIGKLCRQPGRPTAGDRCAVCNHSVWIIQNDSERQKKN